MRLSEFAKKHELSEAVIHVMRNQGTLDESLLYKPANDILHINEEELIRRRAEKDRRRMYIQDMYFLFNRIYNDSQLGEKTNIIPEYFRKYLWRNHETSILTYHLNGNDQKFYDFCTKVHWHIRYRLRIEYDIAEILDAEAMIAEEHERQLQSGDH